MKRILLFIFAFIIFGVFSNLIRAADPNSESALASESPLAPVYEPLEDDWVDSPRKDFDRYGKSILDSHAPPICPRILLPGCTLVEGDWVLAPHSGYLCQGYYLEEPSPPPFCVQEGEQTPIQISSDKGIFKEEGISTLEGHVHMIQNTRQIFADKALICRNASTNKIETITALGGVKLLEPGLRLKGTRAEIDIEKETKYLENVNFRLYQNHARGCARELTAFGNHRMILKQATYTTCAPGQNTWELRASHVDLNKITGRGRARHARMYMKDLPIFYFPYLDFPIDDRRQTGFLYPIVGNTNNSGFEVATPFYWNIAPNYDATLTPRLYTKRGIDLEGKFRYLTTHSKGELQGAFLPHDRLYKRFRAQSLADHPLIQNNDPRIIALNKGGNARTAFMGKNSTTFNKHLSGNINYQTVGDDNYFMDLSNSLDAANTTQLLQQADLNYKDIHWDAVLRLQKYQTLHPFNGPITSDPYERLPQIAFANYYPDLPCGLDFNTNGEYVHFTHKLAPITAVSVTTGTRYHFRPSIALPLVYPGWYFKPRLQADFLAYNLNLGLQSVQLAQSAYPSRTIPMFDIDTGLIFEREFCLWNMPFIQTLEPRAYYLYVPYRDQNALPIFDTSQTGFDYNLLYRDNRFNGLDRLGDANQLTLGLTSRFLDQCTGYERLSLTIGEIFYFKHRFVTVLNSALYPYPQIIQQEMPDFDSDRSPLVGLAKLRLHEFVTLNALIEWDTYEKGTNKRALWLQYRPTDLNIFNIGYQYLQKNPAQLDLLGNPTPLNQTDVSFAFEITKQWRVLGRWHYDITNKRSMDVLAGIEQQGCCTAIRLSFVRFLQPNSGLQNQNYVGQQLLAGNISGQTIPGQKKYVDAIFFQFIFKGLGSVGHNRLSGTASKAIPGFHWRGTEF